MTTRRGCTAVLVVAAIIILAVVMFVEKKTARATVTPLPGSKIRTIEFYGLQPADTIGVTIAKENGAPEKNYEFRAYSKKFPLGTFDKKRFNDDNPDKYAFKQVAPREGLEVVIIFTNNPNITLLPYLSS